MTRFDSVTGHAAFADLAHRGVTERGPSLRIRCVPLPATGAEPVVELAFAIGRKFGTAVDRNRARRRLRAALVAEIGAHDHVFSGRFLVSANRSVLTQEFAALRRECGDLVERLRVRCDDR